jgi:YVTN family beta-propeller protein
LPLVGLPKGLGFWCSVIAAICLIFPTIGVSASSASSASRPSFYEGVRTAVLSGNSNAIVVSANGNLAYVGSGTDVAVVDLNTGQTVKRIPLHQSPQGFALSSNGTQLYIVADLEHNDGGGVTSADGGSVVRVDLATSSVVSRVSLPFSLTTAIAANTKRVYVANSGSIIGINTSTFKVAEKIPVPEGPNYLATSVKGFGSGAGIQNGSYFYVVNTVSRRVRTTVRDHFAPSSLTVVSADRVAVSYEGGAGAGSPSLQLLSGVGKVTAIFQRPGGAGGAAIPASGKLAYVDTTTSEIAVVDLLTLKEIATIHLKSGSFLGPGPIAISENGRKICVVDNSPGSQETMQIVSVNPAGISAHVST